MDELDRAIAEFIAELEWYYIDGPEYQRQLNEFFAFGYLSYTGDMM